jgi:DNA-binding LacI/PurR family transcriptional regulator
MKKHATIKDVAKRAGVSISTVSRAMNGLDRVSDEARKRVKDTARQLNYTPNGIAVSMVKGRTKNILVVVPDIINEYYTSVVHGVEEVMSGRGYTTIVYASNSEKEKEAELFTGYLAKIIDGAIVVPACVNTEAYKQFGKPIVLVDRYITASGLPGVVIDNFGGSYQIVKLLMEKGHRDVGIIIGELTFNIGQERYMGYEQALKEYGIPVNNDYFIHGDWYRDTGYNGMKKLLALKRRPTAVFATNNLLCIGCIEALKDEGLVAGRDISLVGFDDHILASFVDDGITVVARPMIEMGVMAAEKLFSALKGKNIDAKDVLNVSIVERGSIVNICK